MRRDLATAEELAELFGISERQIRRLEKKGIVERAIPGKYKDEVQKVGEWLNEEILELAALEDSPVTGKRTKTTIHISAEDFKNILKDVLNHFWAASLKQRMRS